MPGLRISIREIVYAVLLFQAAVSFAQPPPADFKLTATAGGLAPWSQVVTVSLDSHGQAAYTRYRTGGSNPVVAESSFTVTASVVQQIWQAIQDSSFFSLTSPPADPTIFDGSFAKVTVTANGASHQVLVKNRVQPQIQHLIDLLNGVIPPSIRLFYQPPLKMNFLPGNSQKPLFGSVGLRPNRALKKKTANPVSTLGPPAVPDITAVVPTHPGTVVAYDVPLSQAVAGQIATLSSKGDFYGDDVSLSVDNTVPEPTNTITVTLYLEFWGSLATPENVGMITADIEGKWNGFMTTGGKSVVVDVVTRVDPGASQPPATPGFHQIELVDFSVDRSYVSGSFGINSGTGIGQWELGVGAGTYAHEAGHLMGLPDRYDDYNKQPDGTWVNTNGGKSYANDDQFAMYIVSKDPGQTQSNVAAFLKKADVYSVPQDGSENDLMANVSKPFHLPDIDEITMNPGLLVDIPAGGVLVNKIGDEQNIVITHSDDLFVKPGENRTVNGIYGACIDHNKGIPDSAGVFDIVPSLDRWQGIAAAGYLLQFVHYLDSTGVYSSFNFTALDAIWRITDNSLSSSSSSADAMLALAGIHLGNQVLDFPRLTTMSTSSVKTLAFVPDELLVADIRPRYVDGSPGSKTTFDAGLSQPVGAGFTTDFSWVANGPDTSSVPISRNGSSGSLTPVRSGVYEIGLRISARDSALHQRVFDAPRKAYLIVPDSLTETFEHAHLADRFPWKTYGDVPWTITGTNAETGSFAAQAGDLAPRQTSVLAINLDLPADGAITFSIRTATVDLLDYCEFQIDSVATDQFWGIADWQVEKYPLKAGRHSLAWKCTGSGTTAGKVWLDNVFFPPRSVVTSVVAGENAIPVAFLLSQNFPNPFNPTTSIRYALPQRSHVTLTVFNILGQQVAVLQSGDQEAGYHEVRFDGTSLASGVYFYKLQAADFVQTRKLLLVR